MNEDAHSAESEAADSLAGLNPRQRAAVEQTEGPLLVLSGAGTGKTRVLISRLARILGEGLAPPWNCLAVTFTNRAAREMTERVGRLAGPAAEAVWLGTFHSLCARILRRHADRLGFPGDFTILDTDDQVRLIRRILEEKDIDSKKYPPKAFLSLIQRLKDRGLPPSAARTARETEYSEGRLLSVYEAYQARLFSLAAMDFGDLLMHNLTLLKNNPDLLADYRQRFHYILVDEYQDTNVAQYLWLRLLAAGHNNLCCVGDDDQSIYSWRGAEIGNILRFESDFPDARVIRLETNYRSTAPILQAAAALIARNTDRMGKTLRPAAPANTEDPQVSVRGMWSGDDEARFVTGEIELLRGEGVSGGEIGVLVRTAFQMRAFEEQFVAASLPYRVVGGPRFYERQEIRDAVAYIRLVVRPEDDLAFERVVNLPRRGVGATSLDKLRAFARRREESLAQATPAAVEAGEVRGRAAKGLQEFTGFLDEWREALPETPPAELAARVLEESGYQQMWQNETGPDAAGRLENLRELLGTLDERFESFRAFLDHVALVTDGEVEDDGQRVNLMTLHAAKGSEFDAVFLPGWEEGLFPHARTLEESGNAGVAEERRLAHVGMTRARRHLYISFASSRRMYGEWQTSAPSRFLEDLPAEAVAVESERGLYGHHAKSVPVRRKKAASSGGGAKRFRPGVRVRHAKFGAGVVRKVNGDRLEIVFAEGGIKTVLARFVAAA